MGGRALPPTLTADGGALNLAGVGWRLGQWRTLRCALQPHRAMRTVPDVNRQYNACLPYLARHASLRMARYLAIHFAGFLLAAGTPATSTPQPFHFAAISFAFSHYTPRGLPPPYRSYRTTI